MIEREPGANWRELQTRVATILSECGLAAETERVVQTARGSVEIDVYAVDGSTTPPTTYLCECKRWCTPVPQAEVHAFRAVVTDSGAHHGLFISAAGFQAGAYTVSQHTNVSLVSWPEFQQVFLERWCRDYWVPTFRRGADRLAAYVDPVHSDAGMDEADRGRPLTTEEAIGLMALSMWQPPLMGIRLERVLYESVVDTVWELRNKYRDVLPPIARDTQYLRELLDSLLAATRDWLENTQRTLPESGR